MSSYVQGLLTGGVLVFSALIFMGQQDLELAEQRANNRFDEIVKALEIVYEQIDSTSENNFVKMNELEKKDRPYGNSCGRDVQLWNKVQALGNYQENHFLVKTCLNFC